MARMLKKQRLTRMEGKAHDKKQKGKTNYRKPKFKRKNRNIFDPAGYYEP